MTDLLGRLQERYQRWRHSTTFSGATVDHIREQYRHGSERQQKDAALYSLQLAVDAYIDDEIDEDAYHHVLQTAQNHVIDFYFDQSIDTRLQQPDTDKTTSRFWLQDSKDIYQRFHEHLERTPHEPDRVVGIATSGMEPAMIAAEEYDTALSLVRYSGSRLGDDQVHDLGGEYMGENVLVIDDTKGSGETMETVTSYLEARGAEDIDEMVVTDTA